MSILATLNLDTGKWLFDISPETNETLVEIGFDSAAKPIVFDNLSFGFSTEQDGEITVSYLWPEKGVTYISTEERSVSAILVFLPPDATKRFSFWAENAGTRFEDSTEVTGPRPEKPFDSWVWEGTHWHAPVPYPNDDKWYNWDEDGQQWVVVDNSNYEVD